MIQIADLVEKSSGIVFPYSEFYADSHAAFAEKMWPGKKRRRSARYNRWKFRGQETGPVDGLLLAVIDGRVVGQLGLIPVEMNDGEQFYPAQWACDLMVDPSERHKGLGSLLLAAGMIRDRVTLGSEPSPAADAAMTRLGFRPLVGPVSMVLPLNAAGVLQWVFPEWAKGATKLIAQFAHPFVRYRMRMASRIKHSNCQLTEWQELIPLISSYQQRISTNHIVHDQDFLAWRIQGLAGFADPLTSCRNENSFAVMGGGSSVYYIYDWSADSLPNLASLIEFAIHTANNSGYKTILTLANTQLEKQFLLKLGFLPMRTPIKVIYYHPTRYQNGGLQGFHYAFYDSDGNL